MGFIVMIHSLLLFAILLQNPSLDSVSPKEREAAVEKMAFLGNSAAIPQLAAALKKESKSDIRASMIAALGRIRDRAAVPILADTLHTDLDKDVRLQAIDSLLRLYIPIEDSGPIRTIFSKVKSVFVLPDAPVVGPQVQVDAPTKEALATAMQKDFSDEVRTEAARALGVLKAKDQVSVLTAALEDPQNREHSAVRVQIARTLGVIRDPAAGPALARTLRDSDQKVAQEAILSVGLVGNTSARAALDQIFRTDPNRTMKSKALEALSLLHDKGNIPLFESLLNDKNDYYRELAAEGLARVQYSAKSWKQVYEQEKKNNVRNALAFGLAASGDTDYMNDLANGLNGRQAYQTEVYWHVGGARTALFDWLFARKHRGTFILRIEDTDVERSSEEMTRGILDAMTWLGLQWDEGPYYQSRRLDLYHEAADRLVSGGYAYHDEGAVRFRVPEGPVKYEDAVFGEISVESDTIENFVLLRSDRHPTYHLSVVVDDIDMRISHVVRGADHISNTPKQILLYRALGASLPVFAHLPLILGPDKTRLSKRHGATSVSAYQEEGILPEAMRNFLALLGWAPGNDQEMFDDEGLIQAFSLQGISKANAVFNPEKLAWFNAQYIARLPHDKLAEYLKPEYMKAGLWRDTFEKEEGEWF